MDHQFENFSYNYQKGILNKTAEEIELTNIQRKLLNFFIDNPKTIFSKQELMDKVWQRTITENSIDQVIYILRSHIEVNPAKPVALVTRYGQGISFECIELKRSVNTRKLEIIIQEQPKKHQWALAGLVILLAGFFAYNYFSTQTPLTYDEKNLQQLLVMPMTFADSSIPVNQQQGMISLLKSSFSNLDNEGEILFEESNQTSKQVIEKHFRLKNSLVMIHSQVKKVGNTYHADIDIDDGIKNIKSTQITANSLNELMNRQIELIADFQSQINHADFKRLKSKTPNQNLIIAIGHIANSNYATAKELLDELINQQEDNYQARLNLAQVLFYQKHYDKSLAQLETLKATPAYDLIGTEIELLIARINFVKSNYANIIEDLTAFQLSHQDISEVKKARIKLIIARAHHATGNTTVAMTFYRNALVNIEQQLYPTIFSISLYGQGMIEISQSNNNEVYQLFEQSYELSKLTGDIRQQVLSLTEMAKIHNNRLEWDEAIAVQKQALALLELDSDQKATSLVLAALIPILKQQGYLAEAIQKNKKFGKLANELDSDMLRLYYLHFKIETKINDLQFVQAREITDQHLSLATKTKNYAMVLDNAFLEFELRLNMNDLTTFKSEWDERTTLIKEIGFERFQIYMDLYLARFYKQTNLDEKALQLLSKVSELSESSGDFIFYVEAQIHKAEIYTKTDAKKSLQILNNIEQYNPQPNPYLIIKAKALQKLGKNIEALNLLNQAKLTFHESWTAENQQQLDIIKSSLQ